MERVTFHNVPSFFKINPSDTNFKNEFLKKFLFLFLKITETQFCTIKYLKKIYKKSLIIKPTLRPLLLFVIYYLAILLRDLINGGLFGATPLPRPFTPLDLTLFWPKCCVDSDILGGGVGD